MRILLSRTDRIGDLVLSTPAIASVRASFPQAHITMVTSPYNHVVMERNGDVDELVDLPRAVRPAAFGARFRGYDLAIALAPRAADLRLVGATRASVRVGYTYVRRYVARLSAPLYVNRLMLSEADPRLCERRPDLVVRHEVEQLLALVALAGATQRVVRLRLDLLDADRARVAQVEPGSIVLHLGERWMREGSSFASTVALLRALQRLGRPVAVTVSDECRGDAPALRSALGDLPILGGLGFHAWAAAFERAGCVVTVDTGATHVASAVRRPTVVLFEHRYFHLNSQEWAPYGVPCASIRKPATEDEPALARCRDEIIHAVTELLER